MLTYFILIIDLFEVDFVELIVFIEHFPDVRLTDLLEVNVEWLVIKVKNKRGENIQSRFEWFGLV